MTPALPALPGESPDPSATPRLDALLKEVEAPAPWQDVTGAPFVPLAPRLAAMLRVAVDALVGVTDVGADPLDLRVEVTAVLDLIEAMAKGEA